VSAPRVFLKRAVPFAVAIGIWFAPVPAGLTAPAWHLFAVFVAAIVSVLLGAFPLLTAAMLAVGTVVLTETITPAQAFSGFANTSVLLVVVAFIVAQAVVKSGLGRRISLFMVSHFGGSSLGLAYSIVLTDAAIAPAFPSNTARGGVLFPIVILAMLVERFSVTLAEEGLRPALARAGWSRLPLVTLIRAPSR